MPKCITSFFMHNLQNQMAQSAEAAEYTDCISAEG